MGQVLKNNSSFLHKEVRFNSTNLQAEIKYKRNEETNRTSSTKTRGSFLFTAARGQQLRPVGSGAQWHLRPPAPAEPRPPSPQGCWGSMTNSELEAEAWARCRGPLVGGGEVEASLLQVVVSLGSKWYRGPSQASPTPGRPAFPPAPACPSPTGCSPGLPRGAAGWCLASPSAARSWRATWGTSRGLWEGGSPGNTRA